MKTITHIELPATWASALINKELSGLSGENLIEFNNWKEKNPDFSDPACCTDKSHIGQFDFGDGLKLCDLLDYAYLEGGNL
jgi:hypothetical protein